MRDTSESSDAVFGRLGRVGSNVINGSYYTAVAISSCEDGGYVVVGQLYGEQKYLFAGELDACGAYAVEALKKAEITKAEQAAFVEKCRAQQIVKGGMASNQYGLEQ